jgi:threonine/homoserine/homoserine lactone efflux protein
MQSSIADAIAKGLLVGLFMAISVGPTLFAVIKYSLSFSYKAAIAFVLGVSVSDLLYVVLANVAAAWLLLLAPYEQYIAYGGAIALMAIGLAGLLKKHIPKRPSLAVPIISGGHFFKIWLSGFLINTLNPGVLVTWLGAVTLVAHGTPGYRAVLFAVCLIVILGVDFLKILLAEKLKAFLTVRRMLYMQRFSSACIFAIGLGLLVTTFMGGPSKREDKREGVDKILSYSTPALPTHRNGHRDLH